MRVDSSWGLAVLGNHTELSAFVVMVTSSPGYLFTYYHTKVSDERKQRIDRINEQVCWLPVHFLPIIDCAVCCGCQLREFYGPLLSCVSASKSSYDAMVRQHSPDGTVAGFQRAVLTDPEGKEGQVYRTWMLEVLQPLNEKASNIVVEHIDLLDSPRVEPLLLQLVSHVAAYKVILSR